LPGAHNSRCGGGSKEQATAVFESLERSGSAAQLRAGACERVGGIAECPCEAELAAECAEGQETPAADFGRRSGETES
jgi:hypothetical protein